MFRLQDEIDEVVGCRTEITFEDLSKLEYCGQVFKETLRMYPVVSATNRKNIEEFVCDGYRIPAGSIHMVGLLVNVLTFRIVMHSFRAIRLCKFIIVKKAINRKSVIENYRFFNVVNSLSQS